jgi:hypothetical protein
MSAAASRVGFFRTLSLGFGLQLLVQHLPVGETAG